MNKSISSSPIVRVNANDSSRSAGAGCPCRSGKGSGGSPPRHVVKKVLLVVLSLSVFFSLLAIFPSAEVSSTVAPGVEYDYMKFITPVNINMTVTKNAGIPSNPNAFVTENVVDGLYSSGALGYTDTQYFNQIGTFGVLNYILLPDSSVTYVDFIPGNFFNGINFGSMTDQGVVTVDFYDFGESVNSRVDYDFNGINVISDYVSSCDITIDRVSLTEFGEVVTTSNTFTMANNEFNKLFVVGASATASSPYVLVNHYTFRMYLKNDVNGGFGSPFRLSLKGERVENPVDDVGYSANDFASDFSVWADNLVSPEAFNFGAFISTAVGGFLDANIFGTISIGDILLGLVGMVLIVVFLKFFAGG